MEATYHLQATARVSSTEKWVWVKIRYPNNWMVNTKLDIHICGPTSVFHFDPHPNEIRRNSGEARIIQVFEHIR